MRDLGDVGANILFIIQLLYYFNNINNNLIMIHSIEAVGKNKQKEMEGHLTHCFLNGFFMEY